MALFFLAVAQGWAQPGDSALTSPGRVEVTFAPPADLRGLVTTIATQSDGKLLVGGTFTNLGVPPRNRILRLGIEGDFDETFDTGSGPNATVNCVLMPRADGPILVGGSFSNFAGQSRRALAALSLSGSIDESFHHPNFMPSNALVRTLLRQPDGRVLVGGSFATVDGLRRIYMARLEENGALDPSFSNATFITRPVLLPDGSIIGLGTGRIVRLRHDGSNDSSFSNSGPFSGALFSLTVQNDGKILVGGEVASSSTNSQLLRYHSNGQLDTNFTPAVRGSLDQSDSRVLSIVVQADDRILLGGNFTTVNGVGRKGVARLNSDGSLDSSFDPGAGADLPVSVLSLEEGGSVLVAGHFLTFDGSERRGLARLHGGPFSPPVIVQEPSDLAMDFGERATIAIVSLGLPPPKYQWFFNGAEVTNSTGPTVVISNAQTNDAGGYSVVVSNALGMATSAVARLTVITVPPIILRQPTNIAVLAGLPTNISAVVTALPPAALQWYFNEEPLAGATNATLPFFNINATNSGDYRLLASNLAGTATTAVARVSVLPAPVYPGAVDAGFFPQSDSSFGTIMRVGFHLDGVLLLASPTTTTGDTLRRLHGDGRVDESFVPPTGERASNFEIQPDGRILVAGWLGYDDRIKRRTIARLHANGALDESFDALAGPDRAITRIKVLFDGRMMVGGDFNTFNGEPRPGIARLFSDGSLDSGFIPASGVRGLSAVQPDGKVFTSLGGHLARLNFDGSIDSSFTNTTVAGDARIDLQHDGSIIVNFYTRRTPEGAIDWTYQASRANGSLLALAVQPDNKLVAGGEFTQVFLPPFSYTNANRLLRWQADGLFDGGFQIGSGVTGLAARVNSIAVRDDGAVLIGGYFDSVNGYFRRNVALLHGGPPSAPRIILQPTNQVLEAGRQLSLSVGAQGLPAASYQWYSNGVEVAGATNPVLSVARARFRDSGDYFVVVSNLLGAATSSVATVMVAPQPLQPGLIDTGFDCGLGPDDHVTCIATQLDGRILIGGSFTRIDRVQRRSVARLFRDGRVDPSFDPGAGAIGPYDDLPPVSAMSVQPDQKVIVAGMLTNFNGQPYRHIVRLNADGSTDASFQPRLRGSSILAVATPPDGSIILGGRFGLDSGTVRSNLVRLNADGSIDSGFNHGVGPNNLVVSLSLHPDGSIFLAGYFTAVDGVFRRHIAKLRPDGSLDTNFSLGILGLAYDYSEPCTSGAGVGPSANISRVLVQPDRALLVCGMFTLVDGVTRHHIVRLNPNGSVDRSFEAWPDGSVHSMSLQRDGKILIAGCFTRVDGVPRSHIARLNSNGTVDTAFDAGGFLDSFIVPVSSLAVQSDGTVLVGGRFGGIGGLAQRNFVRLQGDVSLFNPFAHSPTFRAELATIEGRTYCLERKHSVSIGEWTTMNCLIGDGAVHSVVDDTANENLILYRLRAE